MKIEVGKSYKIQMPSMFIIFGSRTKKVKVTKIKEITIKKEKTVEIEFEYQIEYDEKVGVFFKKVEKRTKIFTEKMRKEAFKEAFLQANPKIKDLESIEL